MGGEPDDVLGRQQYDKQTAALVGQTLLRVRYWDLYNFSAEPRSWDYDDWHHAVMGVELQTSVGTFSVVLTSAFYSYGVEVFHQPISDHLVLGPEGPEGWEVGAAARWRGLIGTTIRAATTLWAPLEVGPATLADGTVVGGSESYEVPVALRLDFLTAPVWMIAAMPTSLDPERFSFLADELVVVFTADRMRSLGFSDPEVFSRSDGR